MSHAQKLCGIGLQPVLGGAKAPRRLKPALQGLACGKMGKLERFDLYV